MTPRKLDNIDLHILKILQENSKITNLELSKRIGLSPAPTLERVKKLETNDVISSYHAKVDPAALGLSIRTFVLIDLAWKQPNAHERFIEEINEIPEVVECYLITGEADILLKIVCEDIGAYEQILFTTLSKIDSIERMKTLITLSKVKDAQLLPYAYKA